MNPTILHIAYIVFVVITTIIRWPYHKANQANTITKNKKDGAEKLLLALTALGMMWIPLLFIFTNWLSFADYELPFAIEVVGLFLAIPCLWLFYRSHKDLGRNWSPTLEVREGHNLVSQGVYKLIRHPMYTAIWVWCVVQPLLLQNYIAGFTGPIAFAILYFLRINKEEQMMVDQFGQQYLDYKKRTKRLIPYFF